MITVTVTNDQNDKEMSFQVSSMDDLFKRDPLFKKKSVLHKAFEVIKNTKDFETV